MRIMIRQLFDGCEDGGEVGVSESTVVRFATALDMTGIRSSESSGRTGADEAEFHPAYGSDVWTDQPGEILDIGSAFGY